MALPKDNADYAYTAPAQRNAYGPQVAIKMGPGGEPPAYTLDELRGPGLGKIMRNLENDDDARDLIDSLNHHGMAVPSQLYPRD